MIEKPCVTILDFSEATGFKKRARSGSTVHKFGDASNEP
jgi:hypothetical protein